MKFTMLMFSIVTGSIVGLISDARADNIEYYSDELRQDCGDLFELAVDQYVDVETTAKAMVSVLDELEEARARFESGDVMVTVDDLGQWYAKLEIVGETYRTVGLRHEDTVNTFGRKGCSQILFPDTSLYDPVEAESANNNGEPGDLGEPNAEDDGSGEEIPIEDLPVDPTVTG